VRMQTAARNSIVVVACAIAFSFFFLVIGRVESEHHAAFHWTLNLFTSLPGEISWILGNSLYALLLGVLIACDIGIAIGLLMGRWTNAAVVAFLAVLPSVGLMAWLVPDDPWHLLELVVVMCGAPAVAWWSSKLRGQHAP
jgi:ABC-type nitrate/sulfonate/bicarbonate transport system permease component